MCLKTRKEVWDYLKEEYERDKRIRGMQALNLIREFEMQRMKELETMKEYSDRLLDIGNKRPVRDYFGIIAKIVTSTRATQVMRHEHVVKGALLGKHQDERKRRKKYVKRPRQHPLLKILSTTRIKLKFRPLKKNYLPFKHCGKMGHPPFRCWKRLDAKCNKRNQVAQEVVICKSNTQKSEEVHKTVGLVSKSITILMSKFDNYGLLKSRGTSIPHEDDIPRFDRGTRDHASFPLPPPIILPNPQVQRLEKFKITQTLLASKHKEGKSVCAHVLG
uniref:Uncharacterized protein n=1 Tax=Lactuca sativa TaxID=4236 RepID=A0A9R1WSK2_LACSA|nr:hypothetical protein LSAT_V11C100009090 [Lactuca sativa]